GKTTAFLVPLLARLLKKPPMLVGLPRAVVVTPTRELAQQIYQDGKLLAGFTDLTLALIMGGVEYKEQARALEAGPDIVVCTPGRILDYLKQGVFDPRAVEVAVVDEADRLLDLGFIKDLKYLLSKLPPYTHRQTMLFSATLDERVLELTYEFMNPPQYITAEPDPASKDLIVQELYHISHHEKLPLLLGLLRKEDHHRVLIFCNTKSSVEWLAKKLVQNHFQAEGITGDLPQPKRLRLMEDFKEKRLQIMVATDVASRGIHVEDVSHVYNYDLPQDAENYIHRIGRTARAGRSGRAVSFACEDHVFHLEAIENILGEKIPVVWPEEDIFVPDETADVKMRERPGHPRRGRPERYPDRRSGEDGPGRMRGPARSLRPGGIFGLAPRQPVTESAPDVRQVLSWTPASADPLPPFPAAAEPSSADKKPAEGREGRRKKRRRGKGRDEAAAAVSGASAETAETAETAGAAGTLSPEGESFRLLVSAQAESGSAAASAGTPAAALPQETGLRPAASEKRPPAVRFTSGREAPPEAAAAEDFRKKPASAASGWGPIPPEEVPLASLAEPEPGSADEDLISTLTLEYQSYKTDQPLPAASSESGPAAGPIRGRSGRSRPQGPGAAKTPKPAVSKVPPAPAAKTPGRPGRRSPAPGQTGSAVPAGRPAGFSENAASGWPEPAAQAGPEGTPPAEAAAVPARTKAKSPAKPRTPKLPAKKTAPAPAASESSAPPAKPAEAGIPEAAGPVKKAVKMPARSRPAPKSGASDSHPAETPDSAGAASRPAVRTKAPAGKPAPPAGKTKAPAGKPASPAGKTKAPAGKPVPPAGKTKAPAGKKKAAAEVPAAEAAVKSPRGRKKASSPAAGD
ncbi:MAG: DEAD/DEAH box helicase, partial [Deltaproteobacteria bacterium]|nr:DEAD/DEAH box helicase [Deltaproteobacteria bacterium]